MNFDWDEAKASANQSKHGVSFLEATEVFADNYSSCVQDPDHSYEENRIPTLWAILKGKILGGIVYRKAEHYPNHLSAMYDSSRA